MSSPVGRFVPRPEERHNAQDQHARLRNGSAPNARSVSPRIMPTPTAVFTASSTVVNARTAALAMGIKEQWHRRPKASTTDLVQAQNLAAAYAPTRLDNASAGGLKSVLRTGRSARSTGTRRARPTLRLAAIRRSGSKPGLASHSPADPTSIHRLASTPHVHDANDTLIFTKSKSSVVGPIFLRRYVAKGHAATASGCNRG